MTGPRTFLWSKGTGELTPQVKAFECERVLTYTTYIGKEGKVAHLFN
jgi:hypothetical protein